MIISNNNLLGQRQIDHLVYVVPDLEQGMDDFEELTGVRPIFGGYHNTQGTKNALVGLGGQLYFELLAIDDNNTKISAPRWMGVDLLTEAKMTRWALTSTDLEKDAVIVADHHPKMGRIEEGRRQTAAGDLLKWGIAMPLPEPEVELVPFFIDWSRTSAHPADSLTHDCRLVGMEFGHPEPEQVQGVFDRLGLDVVVMKAEIAEIRVVLDTPKGRVVV